MTLSQLENARKLEGHIDAPQGVGKLRSSFTRRLLKIGEAAWYMGVSVSKLRELAWAGELPYVQEKRNAMMLFEIADLDRWIDGHKVAC